MKADDNKIESVFLDDNEKLYEIHDGDYTPPGREIMSFSFDNDGKPVETTMKSDTATENTHKTSGDNNIVQNISHESMTFTQKLRGLTPKRDNEGFTIKRCYQFRPSTLKKLNILKVNSSDINAYLNEIIDDAVCYYYDAVFGSE